MSTVHLLNNMRNKGPAKITAKKAARLWVLAAIQNYSVSPNKECEPEIQRFIRRAQREIKSLERALIQFETSRKSQVAELLHQQNRDDNDRGMRFEHATRK